ncbi:Clp protease N-terminal domain-containing protein [Streptomyces sp. NPDC058685]|uniref:Clp protease N-terminal domain-containing protein n=1 Tax=Streptomyces sp. NPDC058685 TaxID=3346598 RepID=UPI003666DF7D
MQSPTPWLPQQPAATRAENDARLTAELASALASARRRALRDGDRQIDTAHLLHSLLETDADVRGAFGPGPQVARVLGYLVQRSIGYGLRWQGSVEDSGAVPVVRAPEVDTSGYSPAAVAAIHGALERAERRGEARAGGVDLLAALAADGECRAVEVLARAGVDAAELDGRIESGPPVGPGARLDMCNGVDGPDPR